MRIMGEGPFSHTGEEQGELSNNPSLLPDAGQSQETVQKTALQKEGDTLLRAIEAQNPSTFLLKKSEREKMSPEQKEALRREALKGIPHPETVTELSDTDIEYVEDTEEIPELAASDYTLIEPPDLDQQKIRELHQKIQASQEGITNAPEKLPEYFSKEEQTIPELNIADPHAEARGLKGRDLAQYIENKFGVKIETNGDIAGNFLSKNKRLHNSLEKTDPNYRNLLLGLKSSLQETQVYTPAPKSRLRRLGEALGLLGALGGATAGIGGSLERKALDDQADKNRQEMSERADKLDQANIQTRGLIDETPTTIIPKVPHFRIEGANIFGNKVDFNSPNIKAFLSHAPEGQFERIPLNEFIKMDVAKINGESFALIRGISPEDNKTETIRAFRLKNGVMENVAAQTVQNLMTINNIRPVKASPVQKIDFGRPIAENLSSTAYTGAPLETGSKVGLSSSELKPDQNFSTMTGNTAETTTRERVEAAKKGQSSETKKTLDEILERSKKKP